MTYQKLLYLKYKMGIPTQELALRFPDQMERVSEVALLDIPEETLKRILNEDATYKKVLRLRKRLKRFFDGQDSF